MGKKVEVSYNPQLGYLQTIFHHNFDFLTGIKSYTERTDGVEFVVDTYKENTVKVFIQCVGETAFRFRMYTPGNEHPFDNSIYQLEGQNGVNITENEEFISISKGKIEARVRKYPWEVSYYLDGKLKTKEQIKDSNVDNMCKNLPVGFTYDENKEIIGVISPVEICNRARKILEEKGKEYIKYEEEFVRKFPDGENFQQICATKLAVQELMEENNCSVAAFECWSAFPTLMGLCPCVVLGEMADNGMPLSCETDINGAITLAILRACNLFEESEFLADLTIRHPQNDNAELLWHCGPFPYSLKKDGVEAKLVDGQERFELKQGDLTVCRFDDIDGEYYLFAGEAKTTTGPKTNGTYVWMETDNWKRWEEKLMFGPYIHHLGCVYGHYLPVLREVSRYLGIHFDNAHEQGIYSL